MKYSLVFVLVAFLVGCDPHAITGAVRTSVQKVNGVTTYNLEVDNMSLADTVTAINQHVEEPIAIDPRVDAQSTVESIKIESTDWQSIIEELDEQLTDVEIAQKNGGTVILPNGG
ncbi:hypothetical protein RBSH_03152 [Rhodopirellula baltica SH28]|uniref:Uncharacterized protein n=1 Tax=Rhodopirellula baltica SH28 TaxID=993517 RepID=K5CD52_RHOBT|nr:hypothetical protein [Rhodopirellula baltica]EKK01535.1 hypothetical protein RBSH_03152 [Rhodopirellula baltica SH28]